MTTLSTVHNNGRVVATKKKTNIHVKSITDNQLTLLPEDVLIKRFLQLDPNIVSHAKQAKRCKTFMADLYLCAKLVNINIPNLARNINILDILTSSNHTPTLKGISLKGRSILMVHDMWANDVDDVLLLKLFEELGAKVYLFDVWKSSVLQQAAAAAVPKEDFILCITGPITQRADMFFETLKKQPMQIFWALSAGYVGSNSRNPSRLSFTAKSDSGSLISSEVPDEDGKFPVVVSLNIPEATAKWVAKWPGICALPPRSERLFTVTIDV